MDQYITPIRAAIFVYPTIALLMVVPYAVVHYLRSGHLSFNRFVVFYLFVFYLICTLFLTLLPLPEIVPGFCSMHGDYTQPSFIPFHFILIELDKAMRGFSIGDLVWSSRFRAAMLNIVMTIPLGFFLRYLYTFSFRSVLFTSFGLSFFFEITQLTGIYGLYPCPYRKFEVDDLILNTCGGLLGYWIAGHIPFLPNLNEDHLPAPGEVTPVRRFLALIFDFLCIGILLGFLVPIWPNQFPQRMLAELSVLILYFVAVPAFFQGQTPGKRIFQIRLVNLNGEPIEWYALLIRYSIFLFIPFVVSTCLAYLEDMHPSEDLFHELWWAFLFIWFSATIGWVWIGKQNIGLHDRFSGTRYAEETKNGLQKGEDHKLLN